MCHQISLPSSVFCNPSRSRVPAPDKAIVREGLGSPVVFAPRPLVFVVLQHLQLGSAFASSALILSVVAVVIDFVFPIECVMLQVKPGCILELPDQKARGFLVLIALERLFLKHAHKVFGEIPMRT
jgi:hypothetical protein